MVKAVPEGKERWRALLPVNAARVICHHAVAMYIDSYQFGRIVVEGVSYDSDITICSNCVQSDWYRKQGHSLSTEDLQHVISASPSVLIIGCGASAMMIVPDQVRHFLQQCGIQVQAYDTYRAVRRFNELSHKGVNVAAALHLTC